MGDHADQEQQVQRERPRGLQKIEPGFIGALAAREADIGTSSLKYNHCERNAAADMERD
jgi:hypothetical protein